MSPEQLLRSKTDCGEDEDDEEDEELLDVLTELHLSLTEEGGAAAPFTSEAPPSPHL